MVETTLQKRHRTWIAAAIVGIGWIGLVDPTWGSEPKTYQDTRGRDVFLPMGDLSFADRVVMFDEGKKHAKDDAFRNPAKAIGPADYTKEKNTNSLTLGGGGVLILEFTDNALVNIEGPDLHIFEVGPAVEPTHLAVSKDGKTWIDVGKIKGGTASVDIGAVAQPFESYRFVRLTDLKSANHGRWPGADIDAVAAVGSGQRLSLNSAVLFEFDKADLKPEAEAELNRALSHITKLPGAAITVEGHTDDKGTDAYNQELSEARAQAVTNFLQTKVDSARFQWKATGMGESQPVAPNTTDDGRQQNRRVELIIVPTAKPLDVAGQDNQ